MATDPLKSRSSASRRAGSRQDGRRAGSRQDELSEGTRVVYVSPLKALGYDIERNLPEAGFRHGPRRLILSA